MNAFSIDPAWVHALNRFRPAWWLPGGHAQTLSAAYWTGHHEPERGTPRKVTLPDGDALIVLDDCPSGWQTGDPALLMMHGLGGSARNPFLVRVASKLQRHSVRVFRLNFRGCGEGSGLARLPYNAGRSDDLCCVVEQVVQWCNQEHGRADAGRSGSPLTLFGMSLSGNLLLKFLGEQAEQVNSAVCRAVAINPPIDLARSVQTLDRLLNRGYDRHFVHVLTQQIRHQLELRPDFAQLPTPLPRTMFDFDDRFTARHGGFADAATYYRESSALQWISRITVPTLILTADDDPLVPVEMFREHQHAWKTPVQMVITRGGGHLGYVGSGHNDPDSRWLDRRIVELVTQTRRAGAQAT